MVFAHAYLDSIARPLKVLVWAGEDDEAELWRRQIPICQHFGMNLRDLKGRLILQSYEGCDITLAAPVFGNLSPTPMLQELTEQVRDYGLVGAAFVLSVWLVTLSGLVIGGALVGAVLDEQHAGAGVTTPPT